MLRWTQHSNFFELTELSRAREAPGSWRQVPETCRRGIQNIPEWWRVCGSQESKRMVQEPDTEEEVIMNSIWVNDFTSKILCSSTIPLLSWLPHTLHHSWIFCIPLLHVSGTCLQVPGASLALDNSVSSKNCYVGFTWASTLSRSLSGHLNAFLTAIYCIYITCIY